MTVGHRYRVWGRAKTITKLALNIAQMHPDKRSVRRKFIHARQCNCPAQGGNILDKRRSNFSNPHSLMCINAL